MLLMYIPRPRTFRRRRLVKSYVNGFVASVMAISASSASAQSIFTGSGGNTNWSTPENWNPSAPAAGDDVVITDATGQATLTFNDGSHTIGSLTFGDSGTRSTAFTVANGANTLTLNGGLTANTAAATTFGFLTLNGPVVIGADQTWTIGGTVGTVTSDNGLSLPAGSVNPNPLTLTGKLTKAGPGMLVVVGRTIGDGSIDVNAGALKLNAGSSRLLAATGAGAITVKNGATLMLSRNTGTFNLTKAIAIEQGGTLNPGGGASPGAAEVTSPISWAGTGGSLLAGSLANFTFTLAGNMTGPASATVVFGTSGNVTTGSRSLILAGDNSGLASTISNNTSLSVLVVGSDTALGAGIYRVGSTGAVLRADASDRTLINPVDMGVSTTVGATGTGNFDFTATNTIGSIKGFAIGSATKTLTVNNARTRIALLTGGTTTNVFTKAGPGILELYGPNEYSRPTTISAGTLQVTGAGRIGVNAATNTYAVTVADPGLLDLQVAGLSDFGTLDVTSGTDGIADVNIATGVNDVVAQFILNTVVMEPGTYGSTASGAANIGLANPDEIFSGDGIITVVPEPATVGILTIGVAGLLARRRPCSGEAVGERRTEG